MFSRLGSFAVRFRWFIIAAWFLVAIVLTRRRSQHRRCGRERPDARSCRPPPPASTPTRWSRSTSPTECRPRARWWWSTPGRAIGRTRERRPSSSPSLTAWLTGPDTPAGVDQVLSPTLGDEQTKAEPHQRRRPGGPAADPLRRRRDREPATQDAIAALHDRLAEAPPDVKVYLTGDGPILAAYNSESQEQPRFDHVDHDRAGGRDPADHLPLAGEPDHPAARPSDWPTSSPGRSSPSSAPAPRPSRCTPTSS